ncbi:MAG: hypothetical protein L6R00_17285 [Phycisphaerae bacterium]|nr:hypothetical protein [Phycisphaerae bacterium]
MATMPMELQSPEWGAGVNVGALDYDASGPHEYTRLHREVWPLLVRETGRDSLLAESRESWMRLWGRFGAELFECFWSGDPFIRRDMIARARERGGSRGEIVAQVLEAGPTYATANRNQPAYATPRHGHPEE